MYYSLSDSDEELGLLRKALDVELPSDFDPNKVPQNGTLLFYNFADRKSVV